MKYAELDEQAKRRAREWYAQSVSEDGFWPESVCDDMKAVCNRLGVTGVQVFWSGFWSQGDGACFTGEWSAKDFEPGKISEDFGCEKLKGFETRMAAFVERFPTATCAITHNQRYYHEHSVSYNTELWEDDESDPFLLKCRYAIHGEAEKELYDLFRNVMQWFYRSLETEYEYQTGDEAVVEGIEANDYEFTEDGKIQ